MAQNGFGAYVELHVRKDPASIASFNREIEQAVASAGKIDIGRALTAANIDALTLGNSIQAKLDRFNFQIRIQRFNASGAIATLRQEIESTIGGISVNRTSSSGNTSTSDNTSSNSSGTSTSGAAAEASLTRQRDLLTDIVRLQTQAESLLNKDILGGAGSTGIQLKGIIGDLQRLQNNVSTTTQMSEGEITEINSLFAELRLRLAQVQESVVASGESGDAAAQSYNRQLNLLNLIAQKRKQINSLLSNNTKLAGTGLDTELQNSLDALDQLELKVKSMPYISQNTKDQLTTQINEVRNNVTGIQNDMVTTGNVGNTVITRLINGFKKFGGWMVVTRVLTSVIRLCKQLVTNVKEIDSAMTQLRIVTNASGTEMEKYGDKIAASAKKIGASITDLTDSATTYARLGYSLEESTSLAEYTSMLKAVGDIDVSDAQDAITAITKAFDIDASQIEGVMDKLVTVGKHSCPTAWQHAA